MCTYGTERVDVAGSGKGGSGWVRLTHANVYFDHPYFTQLEHTLNIDFVDEAGSRLAVELSEESAQALVGSIEAALRAAGALAKS